MNIVIRPIREEDFGGLVALVETIQDNLTTLPPDSSYLEERMHLSIRSFYPAIRKPGGEYYLFVLEDLDAQRIAGCCGIIARTGGFDPFYNYQVRKEPVRHDPLDIHKTVDVLHLKMDHKGPSEIGSLFLHQDYRKAGLGRLLSLSRFLFMAQFSERFEREVVAEMRGFIDEQGTSPFWEAICRPFFGTDFRTADILSGVSDKTFIKNLMPVYPIYVDLLPEAAQWVIGRVHKFTEPALKMLKDEGFAVTDCIDIFDGGPMVKAQFDRIRPIRDRTCETVAEIVDTIEDGSQNPWLLGNLDLDYRACLGSAEEASGGGLRIDAKTASLLQIGEGDSIQYVSLRPEKGPSS